MFWLIESKDQIMNLKRIGYNEAFVEVISYSDNIHPVLNKVSLLYIKPLDSIKGYIISLNHSESFLIPKSIIQETLEEIDTIYVRDKKEFLHYFFHKKCYEVEYKELPPKTTAHEFIYRFNPKINNHNQIIPISKHYEYGESLFKSITIPETPNLFRNNKVSIVFNQIEKEGIKINNELYKQYFDYPFTDCVYTQYNLNTTTTRPSNTYGNINFSALNKNNGERECFVPYNDFFLDFDISAYHPTLLAKLVNYNFEHEDIHQSFAEMYGVDYKTSKETTFRQMYGGIEEKYKHLPYFKKVQEFTDSLWEKFNTKGYITDPISGNKFFKDSLPDMNPQKLLSYFLQSLETSNNVVIIYKILKLLRGKNTKLVLYVYDSFLFDVDKNEKDVLLEIKNIFKEHKLKIKVKKGINYSFK